MTMGPRTTEFITFIALLMFCTLIVLPSTRGAMFCFSKRIEVENRCTVHLAHNLSSPVNCCEAYPNAYYIITNISHLTPGSRDHKLYMERLRFIGADNCFASCRKTVDTGKKCRVKPNGKVKCSCSNQPRPVCSTDLCTYKTECAFKEARQNGRLELEVAYRGMCQTGCRNVSCRKNRTCVLDKYERALCIKCNYPCGSYHGGEVCGADNITYQSNCHLKQKTCEKGTTIGVAYKGRCYASATCDSINCGNKLCVLDHQGRPRCVTCKCQESKPIECAGSGTSMPTIICGSNGVTYQNFCKLREDMCSQKIFIDIKHLGNCKGKLPPKDEVPKLIATASPIAKPSKSQDVSNYYISLRNLVDILRNNYPLNITTPKYKKLRNHEKKISVIKLLEQIKTKWRRVKSSSPQ